MTTPSLAGDSTTPAGTYSSLAAILALQSPTAGLPSATQLTQVTDPLLPASNNSVNLSHFWPDLYDLSPESHLTRLLNVLLGDSGTGQLRKMYQTSHMQSVVLTAKYQDMDLFYGALLGVKRLTDEVLDIDPYTDTADPSEWAAIDARDAAYRARIEAFSRAIPHTGTPDGVVAMAQALTGLDVSLYETYMLVDQNSGSNPGGAPSDVDTRTYGDVSTDFIYYSAMEKGTYAEIEGGSGTFGRTTDQGRNEFVVQPRGPISAEMTYHLIKVLSRMKPADALLTVDPNGVAVHTPIHIPSVRADSTYWEITSKVAASPDKAADYLRVDPNGQPVVQPRPALSAYQGESWSYNADIISTTSYVQSSTGATLPGVDFEKRIVAGQTLDYDPGKAIASVSAITLGKASASGQLVSAPFVAARSTAGANA
jgi:hypothetical protein